MQDGEGCVDADIFLRSQYTDLEHLQCHLLYLRRAAEQGDLETVLLGEGAIDAEALPLDD